MIAFQVDDMTCGHCASTITMVVKAAHAQAKIDIDLSRKLVMVDATLADPRQIADLIAGAGFTPQPVPVEVAQAPAAGASCCGTCH